MTDILSTLALGAAKGVGVTLAKHGIEAAIRALQKESSTSGSRGLTEQELRDALLLPQSPPTWGSWLSAQSRPTERRGVALVGPSGAGKSRILARLTGKHDLSVIPPTAAGSPADHILIASRITALADTAGRPGHGIEDDILSLRKSPPHVIVLVLAAGFLRTAADSKFHYRGKLLADNIRGFRVAALDEERGMIQYLINGFRNGFRGHRPERVVVVVNKADLWHDDAEEIMSNYSDSPLASLIYDFTTVVSGLGVSPIFVPVASHTEGFPGHSTEHFTDAQSLASISMLQAMISLLLKDIRQK